MRVTDVCIANAQARLWRKALTLESAIQRRLAWHMKNSTKSIGAGHIARAREITAACQREQHSELVGREINSYLSSRPILNIPVKDVMSWIFAGLPEPGPAQHTEEQAALVHLMNNRGRQLRAKQHQFNLMLEMAYRTSMDWYIIFNTLTVREGAYHKVFAKNSKEFKNYVRNFEREITAAENGTRNAESGSKRRNEGNHRYFAVVEEGGRNGRLHIHIVHLCRTLPLRVHDPNRGKPRPIYRELDGLRRLWAHGYSTPIGARFSPLDAYGKAGWRWPIDTRTNDALQIKSPLALANYMSKYINKGYTSCKRAELLWRVRKSQNLGKPVLEELALLLTPAQQILLATDDTIKLKLNNQFLPQHLIRQTSLKLYDHQSMNTHNGSGALAATIKELSPRPSLLHSLGASIHSTPACNLLNITTTLTNSISNTDDYKQNRAAVYAAARVIDAKYFHRSLLRGGKTSTRDWIHTKNVTPEPLTRSRD